MKRPLVFAIEVVASLALATAGAWIAARISGKFNRSNQAAERIAAALERAYPPQSPLPRPSLVDQFDGERIDGATDDLPEAVCASESYVRDGVTHPVGCGWRTGTERALPAISQPPTPDDCAPHDDYTISEQWIEGKPYATFTLPTLGGTAKEDTHAF